MPTELPPKPELLAPAGTLDAGIAAIDHGADAVYFGLSRFNARERGRNLTLEQGGQLVEHAHANGAKAYVTLNTLIKESELADMATLLGELLLLAPDAVIVQDLGVLRMLRRHFPELPVHASTQMGVHNSAGVEVVAGLGVQRVILQRQVTFDEIRAVQSKVQTELEVFVHGALCCSRSGACLLSSWLGGWSGNRGKCKQPCRRRFHSSEGNGFFLSTNDLCLLDSVPELRRMGVASLKIEGRLRGVDYVTSTVRAYRMMLDAEPGTEKMRIKEARRALSETLGRKWSRGFRTEGDFDHVVQHTSLGGSGLLLGRVGTQTADGFEIMLSRPLARGDRIRVQPESGDEGPSLEVQRLLSHGRPAKRVPGGKTATIGTDLDIPANGYVFKTANRQPDMSVRLAKLPPPTPALPLAIRVHADCLEVSVPGLGIPSWREPLALEEARSHPLQPATVAAEFAKGRPTGFRAGNMNVRVNGDLFFPGAVLKQMRKAFWEWAGEHIDAEALRALPLSRADIALREGSALHPPTAEVPAGTTLLLPKSAASPAEDVQVARALVDVRSPQEEVVLPDFCPEIELPELKRRVRALMAEGYTRFRVTSLFGLHLLPSSGLTIVAGFPLPVANSWALAELLEIGVARACVWPELEREARQAVIEVGGASTEIFAYGRLPLFSTRARLEVDGTMTDSRGMSFHLAPGENGLTLILPEHPLSIPTAGSTARFVDLTHAEPDEPETSSFNEDHALL